MRIQEALVTGILFLGMATGCASTKTSAPEPSSSSQQSAGTVSDARRAAEIHVAMLEKLGEDALRIETRVSGSKAILTGSVKERSSQELAKEIALSVDGINRVSNRITQEGAGPTVSESVNAAVDDAEREVKDAALEARVGINLLEELGRHAFSIEVECTDGVVSLRGSLPDSQRRDLALRTAERTPGVDKVLDLLKTRDE